MKYVIALAFMAIPVPALAQPYIEVNGGINIPKDVTLEGAKSVLRGEHKDGFRVGGEIGYQINRNLRVGLEGSYIKTDAEAIGSATQRVAAYGDQHTAAVLLNGYLDLPVTSRLTLAVGGGVGGARVKYRAAAGGDCKETLAVRVVNTTASGRTGGGVSCTDQGRDGDWALAYQGTAAVRYRLGERWHIGVKYAHLTASGAQLTGKNAPARDTGIRHDRNFVNQSVLLILRRDF